MWRKFTSTVRGVVWTFSLSLIILSAGGAAGQGYPNKAVRILVSEPGSVSDLNARVISQELAVSLGQPVIVETRGGGVIASAEAAARATPDGYTLLAAGNNLWTAPLLQKMPYDAVRDFAPITLLASTPLILVIHPAVPANSVRDLIALAKAKPGTLNYGAGGTGGPGHLAAELFKAMAGVNIVRIPYKSTGTALNSLMGGEVQLTFASGTATMSFIKSGRLKALAATSAKPSALFPGLSTVGAAVPGYESESVIGLFAPAKTPAVIIKQLNQQIVRVVNQPEIKEKLLNLGTDPIGSSPEEFAAKRKSEITRLGKLIKDAGITAE